MLSIIAGRLEPPYDSRGSFIAHHSCMTLILSELGFDLTDASEASGLALARCAMQVDCAQDGAILGLLNNKKEGVRLADPAGVYHAVPWEYSAEVHELFAHPDKPGGELARERRQRLIAVIKACLSKRRHQLLKREDEAIRRHRDPFGRADMDDVQTAQHEKRVAVFTALMRKTLPEFVLDEPESLAVSTAKFPARMDTMGQCMLLARARLLTPQMRPNGAGAASTNSTGSGCRGSTISRCPVPTAARTSAAASRAPRRAARAAAFSTASESILTRFIANMSSRKCQADAWRSQHKFVCAA